MGSALTLMSSFFNLFPQGMFGLSQYTLQMVAAGICWYSLRPKASVVFKILSWNICYDQSHSTKKEWSVLEQKHRLPYILAQLRNLSGRRPFDPFNEKYRTENCDVICLQEVHEESLKDLEQFAVREHLQMFSALYNDRPARRCYLVTLVAGHHKIRSSSSLRVPEGFNKVLYVSLDVGGSEVCVTNVHLPLGFSDSFERMAASDFAAHVAVEGPLTVHRFQSEVAGQKLGFWKYLRRLCGLFWISKIRSCFMVGDMNTLPSSLGMDHGAETQMKKVVFNRGMLDVSMFRPENCTLALRSWLQLIPATVFIHALLAPLVGQAHSTVLLASAFYMVLTCKLLAKLCGVSVRVSRGQEFPGWKFSTFWGYPNEKDISIHGAVAGAMLDRMCVNCGGPEVVDFTTIEGVDLPFPEVTARSCGFGPHSFHVDLDGPVPLSDHRPIAGTFLVKTGFFRRLVHSFLDLGHR